MSLVNLAQTERKWWCKHCQEYFAVKGCGTAYVHKCGYLVTKEEGEKDEQQRMD